MRVERQAARMHEPLGAAQEVTQRRKHLGTPWRRPHDLPVAHQQRIAKVQPQPRQRLAQGRLRSVEQGGCSRQAALAQHHLQQVQVAQLQIHKIRVRHNHYSRCGIAGV
jgi:hypothetical protein